MNRSGAALSLVKPPLYPGFSEVSIPEGVTIAQILDHSDFDRSVYGVTTMAEGFQGFPCEMGLKPCTKLHFSNNSEAVVAGIGLTAERINAIAHEVRQLVQVDTILFNNPSIVSGIQTLMRHLLSSVEAELGLNIGVIGVHDSRIQSQTAFTLETLGVFLQQMRQTHVEKAAEWRVIVQKLADLDCQVVQFTLAGYPRAMVIPIQGSLNLPESAFALPERY